MSTIWKTIFAHSGSWTPQGGRSAELRDEGIEVLMECMHSPKENDPIPVFGEWWRENSLVIRALLTRQDQPFSKDKEKTRLELIENLTEQLRKDLTLKKLAENELSVLVAASVLRSFSAKPGAAFSKEAMLCYYWIIRELYSADRSDWNIGGARAAPGGLVTASTTGECVRALLSFIDALRNTGKFIAEVGNYLERKTRLEGLNDHYFGTDDVLKEWVKTEKDRHRLSRLLTLKRLARYRVLSLDLLVDNNLRINPDTDMEGYLESIRDESFASALSKDADTVIGKFEQALNDISKYRQKECNPKSTNEKVDWNERLRSTSLSEQSIAEKRIMTDETRSESAHLFAMLAVRQSLDRVQKAKSLLDQENKDKEIFKKIKREFDDAADEVHNLLHPARNYLSSILNRELALASLGENWDSQPSELACAAASYGKLTKKWEKDTRFSHAVNNLSKMMSSRGRFANLGYIHEWSDRDRLRMGNAAALHAMAQLLHHACDSEIDADLVNSMLRFFEDTRARQALDIRWFREIDITLGLIKNPGTVSWTPPSREAKKKIGYLRKKLSSKTRKLLDFANKYPNLVGLPKEFSELLACELAKELNQWVQDLNFEEEDLSESNLFKKDVKWAKEQIDGKVKQGKTFSNLLNGLCFRRVLLKEPTKRDIDRVVGQILSDKKGWDWEDSPPPLRTDLKATAQAVMALAKINEMLDARINHIILEYFSVKGKNKGLSEDLTLDSLFYPDYGLSLTSLTPDAGYLPDRPKWIEEKDWPKNGINRPESVAIALQRMRAHVSRVSPSKGDPLISLVLHSPAGTGKTTMIEALAVSCDVKLVEVTPSDLVKYGEEDVEQRAWAVFEALSMLTRAVILFDEFDPVLKRREVGSNEQLNVFSFLTPGMLPKLKDLNNCAKKRSVAYVLVTNLIGKLDEAAVRQGRFDERLGIYPPDLLSRVGRFLDQIAPEVRLRWKNHKEENPLPV